MIGEVSKQIFITALLRDTDKHNELKIALYTRFQVFHDLLEEEDTNKGDNWKEIKEALTSTCQEVQDFKKHNPKDGSV
ncbi:unnamed protein product [Schistosoma margrebowiei]|uniref:Uncharacterized protein n=1 Tax=Schistosoma margrebowiei TaxID=48269 RepID=A0A183MK95_9TREM|nr:unnamed protein product [Schistosoma margrebowiei]